MEAWKTTCSCGAFPWEAANAKIDIEDAGTLGPIAALASVKQRALECKSELSLLQDMVKFTPPGQNGPH